MSIDSLPSFGDLISSLSLSESEPSTSHSRSRSHSRSSLSSLASSTLHTRHSSTSSDDHLSSPPPDISSLHADPAQSMRLLAKSRSVGRLRGSRYAPYKDCSRRPSLPCLLPNISLLPPSPTQVCKKPSQKRSHPHPSQSPTQKNHSRLTSPNQTGNPQTHPQPQGSHTCQSQTPHPQHHQRTRHTRTRSHNSPDNHPSSPISLYARRSHSRTNSLNKPPTITSSPSASTPAILSPQFQDGSSTSTSTSALASTSTLVGTGVAPTQLSPSPLLLFDPPKLPTVPSIQPFDPQSIPQRNQYIPNSSNSSYGYRERESLSPVSNGQGPTTSGYPRQMGLRISGLLTGSAAGICA